MPPPPLTRKRSGRPSPPRRSEGIRYDLALVEIEERFHDLSGAADPYLVSKAEFMSHQIPVQEFEIETAETP